MVIDIDPCIHHLLRYDAIIATDLTSEQTVFALTYLCRTLRQVP